MMILMIFESFNILILNLNKKMDQEIIDARAKLASRFANATQIGGKGK